MGSRVQKDVQMCGAFHIIHLKGSNSVNHMHIQGTLPILPVGLVSKHAQNKHELEFIKRREKKNTTTGWCAFKRSLSEVMEARLTQRDTLDWRRPKLEQKSGQKLGFTKNVGEDTDLEAELYTMFLTQVRQRKLSMEQVETLPVSDKLIRQWTRCDP